MARMGTSVPKYKLVSFSGGKDSTAMLIILLEMGLSFDEILFYDTGAEFPEIYTHLTKVEKRLGVKITRLRPERPYLYWMHEHPIRRNKIRKGQKGYGWPMLKTRWCTRVLKVETEKLYLQKKGIALSPDALTRYIGLAFDEERRLKKRHNPCDVHPLVKFKITEKEALKLCYRYSFD